MNPVPVMPLVEIIRGIATSDEVRLQVPFTNPVQQRRMGLGFELNQKNL